MISHIYFRASQGAKKGLENGPLFFWEWNELVTQLKGLGWAQLLENLTVVIRMKSFDKCSQT